MPEVPLTTVHGASRLLAAWLLQFEADTGDFPEGVQAIAERICEKLCTRMAKLVTAAGCQSLLARALHLAAAEASLLRGVRAGMLPGTCLQGLEESVHDATPEQMKDALLAVLSHLIGLLAVFIGDHMTGRIVHDVWPDAPLPPGGTHSASQEVS